MPLLFQFIQDIYIQYIHIADNGDFSLVSFFRFLVHICYVDTYSFMSILQVCRYVVCVLGQRLYIGLDSRNNFLRFWSLQQKIWFVKVRTFRETHKIWKKSFLCFGRLLSKCPKHEEDWANFCVLLRKSELYYSKTIIDYFK